MVIYINTRTRLIYNNIVIYFFYIWFIISNIKIENGEVVHVLAFGREKLT